MWDAFQPSSKRREPTSRRSVLQWIMCSACEAGPLVVRAPRDAAETNASGFVLSSNGEVRRTEDNALICSGAPDTYASTYVRMKGFEIVFRVQEGTWVCISHFGPPYIGISWPEGLFAPLLPVRWDSDLCVTFREFSGQKIAAILHGSLESFPKCVRARANLFIGIEGDKDVRGSFFSASNFGKASAIVDSDRVDAKAASLSVGAKDTVPDGTVALVCSLPPDQDVTVGVVFNPDDPLPDNIDWSHDKKTIEEPAKTIQIKKIDNGALKDKIIQYCMTYRMPLLFIAIALMILFASAVVMRVRKRYV